jgi:hypothetical protein
MRGWISLFLMAFLLLASGGSIAQPILVEAVNASEPTICAETDNVYVKFISPDVRRFTIEALHPVYLPSITGENKEPDFTDCQMTRATDALFTPRTVTLHDEGDWKLIGITYPNFWRGTPVPVRIGDKTDAGLHLLQLWTRGRVRDEEVLVLYPSDGYWRARPLGPAKVGWKIDPILPTAYGSSFLVGPVEQESRPFVDVKDVAFDPAQSAFQLTFVRGGEATVRIAALSAESISLDVTFKPPVQPQFAALRSMFVAPDNADVSYVIWRDFGRHPFTADIMKFGRANIRTLRAGRAELSRHNNTAPDMVFKDFSATAR